MIADTERDGIFMLGTHISTRARRGLATVLAAGTTLAALATAAPAEASTAGATVGGAHVTCTSRQPGLADRLSKDIAGALRGRQGASALALYDRRTATSCAFRADAAFDSASVVKVTVLGALLRQVMEEHRYLTPREVELTTAMITKSDNDATSTLWRQIGPKGIQHFLTLAGMRDTVAGPKGYWGRTQITASDELKLLRLLSSDNPVLDRNARAYALGRMNRVVPDQRWGVSAGAPGTATVHLKNGWLPRATNGWRVHSIGAFTGGGHEYEIVVLSHGNRTMNDGVATVEGASRIVNRDLNAPKTPTAS
ncbi:serine hydrolase [Streptomyces sp. NPDC002668]|uniref:serine hydrolase n=1 Tax=Streptomyces sp. NPDC002668 TaxID=3154422 RepID=UPI00331BA221